MARDGCGQPGHRTLKLTVSEEWADRMNWFFCALVQIQRAKSNFNDFSVDVVKIWRGHLVHDTLKSAEWVYELSLFFACWPWYNKFW